MGVTGLWRLIEPAGKPVPVETLENKVLAVDISIWLHQMVKGYQDAKGAPMPNAHLLGLFQRLCKLLYFRVKPVFVFDGGFPDLKKETIAKRQNNKAKMNSESERLKREIILLLGKKTAVGSLLGKQASPKKSTKSDAPADSEDLFKLPPMVKSPEDSSSESESEDEASYAPAVDLHSIDVDSDNFKSLPLREKHDLLIELKETRKMNSWGKLHELPKDSDNFADFQMNRLLKRRKVQECLEETEKEIGGNTMTLNELESLLNEEGIDTNIDSLPTRRIASNNTTRYLLISNVKQALEDAKKLEMEKAKTISSTSENVDDKKEDSDQGQTSTNKGHDELDDDLQKAIQMSLECDNDDDKSKEETKGDESPDSTFMLDSDYSDTSEEETVDFNFTSAKAFIMQNSDFTSNAIKDIITTNNAGIPMPKPKNRVDEIMKDLKLDVRTNSTDNKVVALSDEEEDEETVNLSSSEDECVAVKTSKEGTKDKIPEQETIILDTTVEESDVSLNDKIVNTANEVESLQDDSDSDEDFEEVPDNESVEQTLKPVVELNLEMKDTIEDDIFADVFENKAQDMKDIDKIELKEILKEDAHKSETVSPIRNIIKPSTNTEPKLIHDTILISETNKLTSLPSEILHDKVRTDITESLTNEAQFARNSAPKSSENEEKNERGDEVEGESDKEKMPYEPITNEQLTSMAEQLQTEHEDLLQEKSRLDRMGRNITEQMTRDAQELLQIFGIPYVVAPSEAEAQCAFLESVKLTDGTITDDSDIWLFGGKTVYKNFFNQKKHVVQFLSERIDRSFNLSREQLILLALLVGSDYTTGVNGIGPVTAMEILASFSCSRKDLLLFQAATNPHAKYMALLAGLLEFKKWVRSGKRTDDTSLRKKLRNVAVTDDFPSLRVVQAYMEPKIENSEEKFTWGEPDLTVLRDFTRKKFGWSQNKLDEMLSPVLKRMQERRSQRSVQDYFQRKVEFHSLEDQMSKRVKAAVEKMGPKSDDAAKTNMEPPKKIPKKRKPRGKANQSKSDNDSQLKPDRDGDVANLDGPSTSSPVKSHKEIPTQIEMPNVICAPDATSSGFDIVVKKLDRYQEIIPQREQNRMNVLKNKLKAIEAYRKSKLKQKGGKRRRVNLPKEKADLSESSDSD